MGIITSHPLGPEKAIENIQTSDRFPESAFRRNGFEDPLLETEGSLPKLQQLFLNNSIASPIKVWEFYSHIDNKSWILRFIGGRIFKCLQ